MKNLEGKFLFIEYGLLGDAVIANRLIYALGSSSSALHIDVFTKPELQSIFSNNPFIRQIYSGKFPLCISKKVSLESRLNFFQCLKLLRQNKYDYCFNSTANIRLNLLGKLIKPKKNITVKRPKKHGFNQHIKTGAFGAVDQTIDTPDNFINIYDETCFIGQGLGCLNPEQYIKYSIQSPNKLTPKIKIIGIHPLASAEYKMWPITKWKELSKLLLEKKYRIYVYCSPSEQKFVKEEFEDLLSDEAVAMISIDLPSFMQHIKQLDLLIGLDSFSVHAADAAGIPSVMLIGANDGRIWLPPNGVAISNANTCERHPCYLKPKCLSEHGRTKLQCIRSIDVENVLQTSIKILKDLDQ